MNISSTRDCVAPEYLSTGVSIIMRYKLIIFLVCLITVSDPVGAISFDEARYLLSRTGFGTATPEEIEKILPLSYEAAVDQILNGVLEKALTPLPKFKTNPTDRRKRSNMNAEERQAFNKINVQDRKEIRYWWIQEMLETPSPFTEHMVLF